MPTKPKTEKASAAPEIRAQGHTPGPWTWHVDETTHMVFVNSYVKPSVHIGRLHGGLSQEQNEANARLIAAAPDLLAFVRRWQDVIVGGDSPDRLEGWAQDFNNEARAAIAKAEESSV